MEDDRIDIYFFKSHSVCTRSYMFQNSQSRGSKHILECTLVLKDTFQKLFTNSGEGLQNLPSSEYFKPHMLISKGAFQNVIYKWLRAQVPACYFELLEEGEVEISTCPSHHTLFLTPCQLDLHCMSHIIPNSMQALASRSLQTNFSTAATVAMNGDVQAFMLQLLWHQASDCLEMKC